MTMERIDNNGRYRVDSKSMPRQAEADGSFPVPHLMTMESPKQILTDDFPEHEWPVHGCWGYDENTPTVIDLYTEREGVAFEDRFIYFRTVEELNGCRSDGGSYTDIHVDKENQLIIKTGNRYYDEVEYAVTAISPENSGKISYRTVGYFDITKFFGRE